MAELINGGVLGQMHERLALLDAQADQVYMYTPALYQHSFASTTLRLDEFLAYDEIVPQPEKVAELHEMRISAKRLRYTMETFASLYANQLKPYLAQVRKAQELLGDIHDCDVWKDFLPQFTAEEHERTLAYFGHARPVKRLLPGLQYFENDRLQARGMLYEEFVSCWQTWKQEDVWANLRAALQTPFPKIEAVYPPPK
jgi:CHAD domain-containing protein